MTEHLRVAFVGVDHPHGAGWRDLLANVADDAAITAIVPAFGGAVASLEERYADVPRFASVEQLLQEHEFDGAVVCLPNCESPRAIKQLAESGKHVLAEKPIAASAADFQPAVEAIERNGVAFQHGYMWRYDDCANRLRRMIAEDRFGKLISVEMSMVTSDVHRRGPEHYLFDQQASGRGFFNWLACHYFDLMLHVTAQTVVGVTARVGCFGEQAIDMEDGGVAICELSGGGLATFTGGYWIPRWSGESGWQIRGSRRWVHWDPGRAGTSGALDIHGPQPQWYAMEDNYRSPPDETLGYGGRNALQLVSDWIDCCRSDRASSAPAKTALATLQLLDAIYQSSEECRRVECSIGFET